MNRVRRPDRSRRSNDGMPRLTRRLMLFGLGSLLAMSLSILLVVSFVLRSSLDRQAWRRIDANTRITWHMLHEHGGAVIRDGRLTFGTLPPSRLNALLDDLQRVAGGASTIMQGDLRIATTLRRPNGSRGVGTVLEPGPVRDALILHHRPYLAKLSILGTDYYAAYLPIDDASGHQIGILCVDMPQKEYLRAYNRTRNGIVMISTLLVLVATAAFWRIGKIITARIERDADELHQLNDQFDVALGNMCQGLIHYDDRARVVVVNRRYREIFDLPPGAVRAGMSLSEVIAIQAERGNYLDVTPADLQTWLPWVDSAAYDRAVGAKVVAVNKTPLPNGGCVFTFEDVTLRRRAEEQSAFLAWHDPLTGLGNRSMLQERLNQTVPRLAAAERAVVFLVDLDNFKTVNDLLGHPTGDRLLQTVARRLEGCVRSGDFVSRLGGDEFAIIAVLSSDASGADEMAARILGAFDRPFELDGHQVDVSASLGISVGECNADVVGLLRTADLALYTAKAEGRGVHRAFSPDMELKLQIRRALEADLRQTLAAGGFELFYQPICDARTGRIVACEALLRWPHPLRGMIPPAEFIHVAEEMGLIVALGEWVLHQACAEAALWPDPTRVAINLSPIQFRNGRLSASVQSALVQSGLDPRRLDLEITESGLMQNSEQIRDQLHDLRGRGIRIAMDDFGTGYSSLSYLRSFPLDELKIDQSFVADLGHRPNAAAIIGAIKQLADSLQIRVVAEGVETEAQRAQLCDIGIDELQGYLLARPMPAARLRPLLDAECRAGARQRHSLAR